MANIAEDTQGSKQEIVQYKEKGKDYTIWIILGIAGLAGVGFLVYTIMNKKTELQEEKSDATGGTSTSDSSMDMSVAVTAGKIGYSLDVFNKKIVIIAKEDIKIKGGITLQKGQTLSLSIDYIPFILQQRKDPPVINKFMASLNSANAEQKETITVPKGTTFRLWWSCDFCRKLTLTENVSGVTRTLYNYKGYTLMQKMTTGTYTYTIEASDDKNKGTIKTATQRVTVNVQ